MGVVARRVTVLANISGPSVIVLARIRGPSLMGWGHDLIVIELLLYWICGRGAVALRHGICVVVTSMVQGVPSPCRAEVRMCRDAALVQRCSCPAGARRLRAKAEFRSYGYSYC